MKKEIESQEFKKYADLLKNNGFDIYVNETENPTWGFFVKGNNIGYVEYHLMGGFNFSTVHKPNSCCGTGYSIHREVSYPTIRMAEDCFITAPRWADSKDSPRKYNNWLDYCKSPVNQILNKIKL